MSEPVDPPPETVSRRHLPETGPSQRGDGGGPLAPRGARTTPPALEADTPRLVLIGTGLWLVALVLVAVFRGDETDWIWTCVTGIVLGVLGVVLARRAARR